MHMTFVLNILEHKVHEGPQRARRYYPLRSSWFIVAVVLLRASISTVTKWI